jgi:predicted kinase
MTRLTYDHLLDTARNLLSAGFSVIVDATFLDRARRQAQRSLAEQTGRGFLILSAQAPVDILRQRIQDRLAKGADPSEASIEVLQWQLDHNNPLEESERPFVLTVDTSNQAKIETIMDDITRRCGGEKKNAIG